MKPLSSLLVDTLSFCSIVGIWPRYIEPKFLKKTYLEFPLSHINSQLKGLKIIHFTDLHFHQKFSFSFLKKIIKTIRGENPDLLVFTGDFLCYSRLEKKEILQEFLNAFSAPLGCFCIFGNHDYASYVSRDHEGNYKPKKPINPLIGILKGISVLFFEKSGKRGKVSEEAKKVLHHEELHNLLHNTPFKILENATCTLPCGLNIVGLGDYSLGRMKPTHAFKNYDMRFPGIILSHNPDSSPFLASFPGNLILSGHTHGEQIHFPFCKAISRKLARLENPHLTRGLCKIRDKTLYINRGLGGHEPFRFCSPPELLILKIT